MKQILLVLPFLCLFLKTYSQNSTVSGYIKDAASGEALIGATCYIPGLQTGVTSNQYGFYSLTLPTGNHKINFSFIGYETQSIGVDLKENKVLNISLAEDSKQLEDVVVTGTRRDRNIESTEMSMEKISVKLVKKLPSFMGEVDVLKTITLLPGIQNGGEGSSGLYVRGGGPDENLMILDEAPVYNASHLMGFFSVFNSDAIKDIEVYKGGIPSKYGGKASSVVDIRMKDGNINKFHGQAGIGNISSRLTLEGPVIKDKWSFIVSGRRTYADVVGRMLGLDELKENKLYFYDLNLKTNIQFSHKDRLYISAYTGDDNFKLGESIYMRWGNVTGTARWNHIFGNKLFSNTSFIYSNYGYKLGVPGNSADQFDWDSHIKDYNFKEDFSWFLNANNRINFGINIIKHHFEPGNIDANENSFFEPLQLTNYNAVDGAVYASNEQKIGRLLTVKYGFRLSAFQQIGVGKEREYQDENAPNADEVISETSYKKGERIGSPYIHLEPRVSLKLTTGETSSIKASYNRMVQNLHLISNTTSPTPLDIWLPTSKYIKPLIADQIAAGYFRNFGNNAIETSVEVYYKDMKNVLDYKDGAELFLNEDLETELLTGTGYAYGMEMLIKKQEGRFTGWASYTLAKAMRKIPGINNGEEYPSTYDRTHDLSLVLNYEVSKQLSVAANWVFSTGNPITYPVAKYDVQGNTMFYYSKRNGNRIPDYHRMDLSFTYDSKKNEHRKVKRSLNVSFYNVYARRNAYSIYFRPNEDNPNITEAVRLSIIGTVIPSVTYNITF
ncbi:TonB-dependent receptor [Maribellus maritimus]|uniref:TonB-dependent receptor n=1 Tax=Maribellus maritimus TaxID=2870838 RepID=UPI001EE9B607|nr:carboxypeptidase-like regulatory domain-containing protein [Maribellus maritimus]MCG6188556.1 TonB-dependent receptor [Maribellus maritimus]